MGIYNMITIILKILEMKNDMSLDLFIIIIFDFFLLNLYFKFFCFREIGITLVKYFKFI